MSDEDFGEDLDDETLDFDDEFEDFGDGGNKTLGELWQENPAVKIGGVVLGILVLLFIFSLFGGEKEEPIQSMVGPAKDVSAAPGTEEASPAYVDAVIEENETRVEEAIRDGGSALPTPIEPPIGRLTVPEEEKQKEDPLQKWRRLQEERLERELKQAKTVTQTNLDETGANGTQALQIMTEAMSTQMQAILERNGQVQKQTNSITITAPNYLAELLEAAENEEALALAAQQTTAEPGSGEILLIPQTEIEYAQTLIEANSDIPGPVLAQIVTGPLNGARILGSFSKEEEYLTLNFTSAVLDGVVIPINAIALDPATTLPALATDVNHRYFQRIVLPAAAAFIEGMADAIEESGRTTITVSGETVTETTEETTDEQEVASGIAEAGSEIGEIIDEMGDVETLVRVESGTPMALLFLSPVVYTPPGNNDTNGGNFPPVMNAQQ